MLKKILFIGWIVSTVLQSFAINIDGNPLFYHFILQLVIISVGLFGASWRINTYDKNSLTIALAFFVVASVGVFVLPKMFGGTPAFIPRYTIDEQVLDMRSVEFGQTNLTALAYYTSALIMMLLAARGQLLDLSGAFRIAATPAALIIALSMFFDFAKFEFWTNALAPFLRNNEQGAVFEDLALGDIQRLSGVFSEPSYAGIFGAGLFVYFFSSALERKSLGDLIQSIVMVVCTIATTSFIGFAGLAVGLVAISYQYRFAKKLLLLVGGAGVLLQTVASTIGGLDFDFFSTVYLEKFTSLSAFNRLASDLRSFEILQETSYLGVGLGSHRASSLFSTLIANTGLIGAPLFFVYNLRLILGGSPFAGGQDYNPLKLYTILIFILLLLGNAEIASPIYLVGLVALISSRSRSEGKRTRVVDSDRQPVLPQRNPA